MLSVVTCPFGICMVRLEKTPRRTGGLGAGFEGRESAFLSLKRQFGAGEGGVCAGLLHPQLRGAA